MRVIIATLAGWVVLSAVSVQAVPLPLAKPTLASQLGADPPIDRAGRPGMRIRLSVRPLARPAGLLALGQMRSEVVGKGRVWLEA